jgi:hypothetical protein
MTLPAITLAAAALLSGAVIAVFAVLVAGIHSGDRHQLTSAPGSQLEAFTRNVVGLGVRTCRLPSHGDRRED